MKYGEGLQQLFPLFVLLHEDIMRCEFVFLFLIFISTKLYWKNKNSTITHNVL